MPSSDSLSGLLKWLGREEWRGAFEEVLHQHLGPACEAAGIEFDEIAGILGDHHFMMLWACAFEDFLTRDSEPGGAISSMTTSSVVAGKSRSLTDDTWQRYALRR